MKRYWLHMVNSTEKIVEMFLKKQVNDTARPDYGRMDSDVVEGKQTIYMLTDALCLYFCKESSYYKDAEIFDAVKRGIGFVERWQRPDGSLDFPTCNFFSAPDTSFCFRRLRAGWRILRKYGGTKEEKDLEERYLILMLRCIPIILYGGFHTPNHRWAVTAALLSLANMTEEYGELALSTAQLSLLRPADAPEIHTAKELTQALRDRAEAYLVEGIDGDEDGEFAERSTGNYNAVVDKSLILAYEMTGEEKFLGYVERNLNMMLYYFDGDDTVFTQNSTRQDQGREIYPDQYFYLYTYMADRTGSAVFDAAAHKIIKDNQARAALAPDCMYYFMLNDRLKEYEFKGYGYLETYRKYFPGSQVLRVKKKEYVYTVLNQKASFLYLKFGSLTVRMRIGEAYCDTRSVIPQSLEQKEDGCVLKSTANGWYYLPFKENPGTSDWWKMDHSKRELLITSKIDTTVTIRELPKGLEITVKTEGLDRLPLRVELSIPAECVLETDSVRLCGKMGESLILKDGFLTLTSEATEAERSRNVPGGIHKVEIGPGYGTHSFKGHYSGEVKNEFGYSIFLNDYTPYERTFHIVEI
ncbi:MAG: hypothetical protein LUF27_07480 [Lachnospiraceae bacterium]|nr:hypothetical protein [Lachnospiraceae bacterium]